MQKVVAILSILSILAEVPSCNKKDDIGEGGVVASPGATSAPANKPLNPHVTRNDRQHKVTFFADWKPDRGVYITWSIDGKKHDIDMLKGPFRDDIFGASQGSHATLMVGSRNPGYVNCKIMVDGEMITPPDDATWIPHDHGYNRRTCSVAIVIP